VPPTPSSPGGHFRRFIPIAAVVVLVCAATSLYHLGSFLCREDPLDRADAIFVLAGTRMERPLEAADLYLQGYAPYVVLTRDIPDSGVLVLERRGLTFPSDAELARDTLVRLGVPPAAILLLPRNHDSTREEVQTLRELVDQRHWKRIIIVTSKLHTRRAAFAARRALVGTSATIVIRATRYDPADPAHWWRVRRDLRNVLFESQKLVAYWLSVGS
jgi:uncharacterized SAM-binding protein YcdF (DUF218 family)